MACILPHRLFFWTPVKCTDRLVCAVFSALPSFLFPFLLQIHSKIYNILIMMYRLSRCSHIFHPRENLINLLQSFVFDSDQKVKSLPFPLQHNAGFRNENEIDSRIELPPTLLIIMMLSHHRQIICHKWPRVSRIICFFHTSRDCKVF